MKTPEPEKMLRLAFEHRTLARVPKIRKLAEASPRAGFVEDAQLQAIRRRLLENLQAAVTIAFGGMRFSPSSGTSSTSSPAPSGSTSAARRTAGKW